MSAIAETLGMARSNLVARLKPATPKRRGRPPQPDADLLARIKAVIADMPTYGYRRVHAILRRKAAQDGGSSAPNHKRIWRVMKQNGLLLQRHAGGEARRHDGRVAVDERNRRWCSDGFEIGCDNGERVRVAFALDCCDREAMSFIATTGGIAGEHVQDLIVAAVEHRFGLVNRLPNPVEWLSDNGSCYVAKDTRKFARDIGLEPRTTPIESPQSTDEFEQLFLSTGSIILLLTGDHVAQSRARRCKPCRAAYDSRSSFVAPVGARLPRRVHPSVRRRYAVSACSTRRFSSTRTRSRL